MEDAKQAYYNIIISLWKMFKEDVDRISADMGHDSWLTLVGKYDTVYQTYRGTPYEHYAAEMVMAHVHELEAIWRRRFFEGIPTEA